MRLRGKVVFVLLAVLICGTAGAQVLSNVPASHSFWNLANRMLFVSHAALEAVDFGGTHQNLDQGGKELDPLGKALCRSGTPGQLVFFGGRMAGVVAVSYLLHKTGHHKLERAFPLYASG